MSCRIFAAVLVVLGASACSSAAVSSSSGTSSSASPADSSTGAGPTSGAGSSSTGTSATAGASNSSTSSVSSTGSGATSSSGSGSTGRGGPLVITTSLALSESPITEGDTVTGTVTYTNQSGARVTVGNLALAARPPGGSHSGGPYDDLQPWVNGHTFAPGERFILTATRTFTSADPVGSWDFYPTYEYPAGSNVWFDGPDTYQDVQAGASTSPSKALQGVYPGFADSTGMGFLENTWEPWLGRKMKFIDLNMDVRSWSDSHSDIWAFWDPTSPGALWTRPDITPAMTVILTTWDDVTSHGSIRAALQATASGANDSTFQYLCDEAKAAGVGTNGQMIVARIGHEADCDCYPWEFQNGNVDVYIAAFQHVATLLRSCFNHNGQAGVLISYNPTHEAWVFDYKDASGTDTGQLEYLAGYPGDGYVDIIGMDLYSRAAYPWSEDLRELNDMESFAVAHGKQVALPEWGLWTTPTGTGDDPSFVQGMYDWMNGLPATGPGSLALHCYFDQYQGVEIDNFPNAKQTYQQLFGGP